MSKPTPHPRFNHVAMSVPADLLDETGRTEILEFYGEVFGWTEMPTLTRDRELLVLRAYSHEQFVFLMAGAEPMRAGPMDHFGMSVPTLDLLDGMYERAAKRRETDPRVELLERKVEDYKVLSLHSFYVRFRLPLLTEVQCYEWASGFDEQSVGPAAG
ncbi:MAG: VOC family protein [Myxococcota bacterium]